MRLIQQPVLSETPHAEQPSIYNAQIKRGPIGLCRERATGRLQLIGSATVLLQNGEAGNYLK